MTDSDMIEAIEAVYEYVVWAADMGMIDFDAVAVLADVIRELRLREARDAA
jgi:hypothetical protein